MNKGPEASIRDGKRRSGFHEANKITKIRSRRDLKGWKAQMASMKEPVRGKYKE